MAISTNLKQQIEMLLDGQIQEVTRVSGGDISKAFEINTQGGRHYFLKLGEKIAKDMFIAEANGLKAIAATKCIRSPEVIAVGEDFLLLERIKQGSPRMHYWTELGRQLAQLHTQTAERFGFEQNNYCGATPQPNPWNDNGYEFFAAQRLNYQAKLAFDRGLLSGKDVKAIEQLCNRLPELIPYQPPSLLHGDLWSGNQLCDEKERPVLFDPACYYGWAEAEIAMTQLFGGFDKGFYQSYQEASPLETGWEERCGIYNLYHLLNHLNLFGPCYYDQVAETINHYR